MNKLLTFVAACLFSSVALAQNLTNAGGPTPEPVYGRWFCSNCELGQFNGMAPGQDAISLGYAVAFLTSVVNPTHRTRGWVSGETVEVCDRVICVQLYWRPGIWYFAFARVDPQKGYRNSTTGGWFTPYGPPGYYYAEVYGHWEYTYYFTTVTCPTCAGTTYNGYETTFVYDGIHVYGYDMTGGFGGGQRRVPIY